MMQATWSSHILRWRVWRKFLVTEFDYAELIAAIRSGARFSKSQHYNFWRYMTCKHEHNFKVRSVLSTSCIHNWRCTKVTWHSQAQWALRTQPLPAPLPRPFRSHLDPNKPLQDHFLETLEPKQTKQPRLSRTLPESAPLPSAGTRWNRKPQRGSLLTKPDKTLEACFKTCKTSDKEHTKTPFCAEITETQQAGEKLVANLAMWWGWFKRGWWRDWAWVRLLKETTVSRCPVNQHLRLDDVPGTWMQCCGWACQECGAMVRASTATDRVVGSIGYGDLGWISRY